ncbi:response regulator [Paenibacillus sp. FSL M8-0334]|uniref:response regulator n=1 Tax=Paenibacillus sp. FSL M8-0334 TaxID=2921623 RepID=UPI0030F6AB69
MYKVLIVDDERIEREGLHAILQHGIAEIAIEEAANGKAAVEMARAFEPDLILMDIKMPGMNGLEAIRHISELRPETRFMMVTAFDTFDYARQAIKLGVKDYLLKPSKAREIVASVTRVLEQIGAERQTRELLIRQQAVLNKALPLVETDVVTQLLFDHVHDVHLEELLTLLGRSANEEMYAMKVTLPEQAEHLYAAVKDRIRQEGICWIGAMCGLQIPVIVFRERDRSYRNQAVALAQAIMAAAGNGNREGWFVGIGNVYGSLHDIRQSYQEAMMATMDMSAPVKYRFYEDMPVQGTVRDWMDRQQERAYLEDVRLGRWESVLRSMMDVIERLEHEQVHVIQAQQRMLEMLWIASRLLTEMGMAAEKPMYTFQARDYRQFRAETIRMVQTMQQHYEDYCQQTSPDLIYRIKQYIEEHAHADISLEVIAEWAGLNPYYISKWFKDQTGMNYIDFLTECRIEKAKQLMRDPDRSLKEITYEVGYHDPNYFSKVFRKTCGVSPTEYRKQLLQRHSGAKN